MARREGLAQSLLGVDPSEAPGFAPWYLVGTHLEVVVVMACEMFRVRVPANYR